MPTWRTPVDDDWVDPDVAKTAQGQLTVAKMLAHAEQQLAAKKRKLELEDGPRGSQRMAKLNDGEVVEGSRSRTKPEFYEAAPATNYSRYLKLVKRKFSKWWWEQHIASRDAAHAAEALQADKAARHGERQPSKQQEQRKRKALRTASEKEADTKAKLEELEKKAAKVAYDFEHSFTWEERKNIAVQAFYSEFAAVAAANGTLTGGRTRAYNVAARAAGVGNSAVQSWIHDYENNDGFFSPSMWGAHTKTASIVGDIETRRWARRWVIDHMGHRRGQKNKTSIDFQEALHERMGFEWDPENPTIGEAATLRLLKLTGARWTQVKQGYTHTDNHGADHVVHGQRPAYLDMYQQFYNRGPNFILDRPHQGSCRCHGLQSIWRDKDDFEWDQLQLKLQDPRCFGPRGINMGGAPHPDHASRILPFARNIDFAGKIWHITCHDEACVHSLKGEECCWLIPGVGMGDIPQKSEGEYEHLAENDSEMSSGTISLDGTIGQTSRKELKAYIAAKRLGACALVPRYTSIRMHGGSGGEGSWTGDDAAMQFELIMDVFDIKLNMLWIEDPLKATTLDLLAVTPEQRKAFRHGLCCQGDRSQGHLKMAVDCLNANKICWKDGQSSQPHFRHTFAPLPAGAATWRDCREALCSPGCNVCQKAVDECGHRPDFQSVGKKGSRRVLTEMGVDCTKLNAKKAVERLKECSNWSVQNRKSAIQELFESRGHFFLIGAACHAELAHKEHGWARLKRHVKPYVDGTMTTLRDLIATALPKMGQRERILDARRCRTVMKAYRTLATMNEDATADKLKLWEKVHKKHRDVHDGEIASLRMKVGQAVNQRDAKIAEKMNQTVLNEKEIKEVQAANAAHKLQWSLSKRKNEKCYDPAAAKARKDKYVARVETGEVHQESSYVRNKKRKKAT